MNGDRLMSDLNLNTTTDTILDFAESVLKLAVGGAAELDEPITRAFIKQTLVNTMLFVEKHHDYGRGNVRSIGSLGVLLRIREKVERLVNLHFMQGTGGPIQESVLDSARDIANLAVMLVMVEEEQWPGVDWRLRLGGGGE